MLSYKLHLRQMASQRAAEGVVACSQDTLRPFEAQPRELETYRKARRSMTTEPELLSYVKRRDRLIAIAVGIIGVSYFAPTVYNWLESLNDVPVNIKDISADLQRSFDQTNEKLRHEEIVKLLREIRDRTRSGR